jgi:glycosyltransferase involved in cell wall biosynthesis
MCAIEISYVLTVFNKADALPATLASLKKAHGGHVCEYIFVDDASKDDSVNVLRRLTQDWANVRIVINEHNAGPSKRLNQGAALAHGDVLMLLDGDDVVRTGAVAYMYDILKTKGCDFVYGRFRRVTQIPDDLTFVSQKPPYISEHPFKDVLRLNCIGMAVMTTRALFQKSGGCDARLFIQDQSLALRLGFYGKRMAYLNDVVVYAPTPLYSLSRDLTRQHHDGFLAFWYAFREFKQEERLLYAKMVSVIWKAKRSKIWWWPFIIVYGFVKWLCPRPFGVGWLERRARCLLAPRARDLPFHASPLTISVDESRR